MARVEGIDPRHASFLMRQVFKKVRKMLGRDETGISNVIVNPDLYEKFRKVINGERFVRVDGVLQNQDHTISIKAARVLPLSITGAETESHDFH